MSCQVTYGEKKSLYDTCHLCSLFRIDGIKAISGGNFRGIQVIRVANTRNRGRGCLFSQNGGEQNTDPQCMDYPHGLPSVKMDYVRR